MGYDIDFIPLGVLKYRIQKWKEKNISETICPDWLEDILDSSIGLLMDKNENYFEIIHLVAQYAGVSEIDIIDDIPHAWRGPCERYDSVDQTYLSYNFSCFEHIWYLRDNLGSTTEQMLASIDKALVHLDLIKVKASMPNENWDVKSLNGEVKNQPMDGWTPDLRVFKLHLERIRDYCIKYPFHFVVADTNWKWNISLKDLEEIEAENPDDYQKVESIVTYFRHPIKGNMKVHNYETAIEVYCIMVQRNDPRAQSWFGLAKQMHDVPNYVLGNPPGGLAF